MTKPLRCEVMNGDGCSNSTRPDLAILIPSYAGGGAERVALFLAQSLSKRGLRVDLVVAKAKGELRDEPLPGVNTVELGAVSEILAAPLGFAISDGVGRAVRCR